MHYTPKIEHILYRTVTSSPCVHRSGSPTGTRNRARVYAAKLLPDHPSWVTQRDDTRRDVTGR